MRWRFGAVLILIGMGGATIGVPVYPFQTLEAVEIVHGGTLLYYNSPAAVQVGEEVYVGYVDATGVVEVASLNIDSRATERVSIHDYGDPDDHAAPGIWPTPDGLLVATAHHSSDLYLYLLAWDGSVTRRCEWSGAYTYPRFTTVNGQLWLYIRSESNGAGNLAVIKSPERCSPASLREQVQRDDYVYATVPDGPHIAWSIYNMRSLRHSGGFVDGKPFPLASSRLDETLMWSISGKYRSATRFSDSFRCCNSGSMVAELYDTSGLVFSTPAMSSPYYPTGIVLADDSSEGLVPTRTGQVERRQLPSLQQSPTCVHDGTLNAMHQYVLNGDGSYVWVEFIAPHDERDYRSARVKLCLV